MGRSERPRQAALGRPCRLELKQVALEAFSELFAAQRLFVSTSIVEALHGRPQNDCLRQSPLSGIQRRSSRGLTFVRKRGCNLYHPHVASAKEGTANTGHAFSLTSSFELKERLHSRFWRCGKWVGIQSSDEHGDPRHAAHNFCFLGITKRADRNRGFWVRDKQ